MSDSSPTNFVPKTIGTGMSCIFFKNMPTCFLLDVFNVEVSSHIQAFFKDNPETNKLPITLLNCYYLTDHITVSKTNPVVVQAININEVLQGIISKFGKHKNFNGVIYRSGWLDFCNNLDPEAFFSGEECPGCRSKDIYCFCGSAPSIRYSSEMKRINQEFWLKNPQYSPENNNKPRKSFREEISKQKESTIQFDELDEALLSELDTELQDENQVESLDSVNSSEYTESTDPLTTVDTKDTSKIKFKKSLISKLLKDKRNKK